MANIKITKSAGKGGFFPGNMEGTTLELLGVDLDNPPELVKKAVAEALQPVVAVRPEDKPGRPGVYCMGDGWQLRTSAHKEDTPVDDGSEAPYNARKIVRTTITPEEIKSARQAGCLFMLLQERTEIDIPMDDGKMVTVVVAHVTPDTARLVFKDYYDAHKMNETSTNKGGYYKSAMRKHILEDILPHIAQEWREIMVPRKLVEIIDDERVEYSDLLWLPSATDMFGAPNGRWWKEEEDSFQLPIFLRERDRVKELGDKGTAWGWLRSPFYDNYYEFCNVNNYGNTSCYYAECSYGVAPGFDV